MTEKINNLWKNSFIYSIFSWLYGLMEHSFIFTPPKLEARKKEVNFIYYKSLYYRILKRINGVFSKFYKWIYEIYSRSIFSKIFEFFERLFKSSAILGKLKEISGFDSLGQIFVIIPVFYIFVDKAIRSLPVINALGSVWDELYLIFLFAYIVARRVNSKGDLDYNRTPMGLPILLFIVIGVSHVLVKQQNLDVAIEGFRAMFQQMLWYFAFVQLIRKKEEFNFITSLLSFQGLFFGLHAVYQYIMKVPMLGNWTDVTETVRTRAFSIVGSPNVLGAIFVILIAIALLKFLEEKRPILKAVHGLSFVSMVLGLLFTFSRGAWLSFAFVVVIFLLLVSSHLIFTFGFFGLIFLITENPLSRRLLQLLSPEYYASSSKAGRLYRWDFGLRVWSKNKAFGVGLGRFGGAVAINNNLAPFYLDNYYLKTLVEMGYFGISAMVIFVVWFVVYSLKVIWSRVDKMDFLRGICVFTGALGVLIQNFVENIFEVPAMMVIFFLYIALLDVLRTDGQK